MPPSVYTTGADVYDADIRTSYATDVARLPVGEVEKKYGRPPYAWLTDASVKGRSAYPYEGADGLLYRFDSPTSICYRLPVKMNPRARQEARQHLLPVLPYYSSGEKLTFWNKEVLWEVRVVAQNSVLALEGKRKKEHKVMCTVLRRVSREAV